MLLPDLTRRALILALGAATAPPPKSSHAATDGLSQLRAAQQTLARVDGLLPERGSWPEAQRLLNTLDDGVLTKALEAAVDPKSVKDIAMDQAEGNTSGNRKVTQIETCPPCRLPRIYF